MTIVLFGESSKEVAVIIGGLTPSDLSHPVESIRQELTGTCGTATAVQTGQAAADDLPGIPGTPASVFPQIDTFGQFP